MNKSWLRKRYRRLPPEVRRVLLNERLRRDLRVLHKLRLHYPKVDIVPSKMAALLVAHRRSKAAVRFWVHLVKCFPASASPFFQRAHWALNRQDFNEAEKYLRLCLIRDRGYYRETAHFWRAEALLRLGRSEEALAELRSVRDDFEEQWFLEYRRRSKADMIEEIHAAKAALPS